MGLKVAIPSYLPLCRRLRALSLILWKKISSNDRLDVVVDSTGLKVCGEGEWKVRIHGVGKRQTWRKLYLVVDERNNRILGVVLTTNNFKDNEVPSVLMDQVDSKNVAKVTGDGAYDDEKYFALAEAKKIKAVLPPRIGAKTPQHGNSKKEDKKKGYFDPRDWEFR